MGEPSTQATPPPPSRLYESATLFDAWEPGDPLSYGRCFDARTYRAALQLGLRSAVDPAVSMARAVHDTAVTRLAASHLADPRTEPVAIMGGHAASRTDDVYRTTAHLAGQLRLNGATVLTGGGPGAMEAAHLGARLGTTDRIDEGVDEIGADVEAAHFPLRGHELISADGSWNDAALATLHRWQRPAFALEAATPEAAPTSLGVPTWLYGHEPPTPLASVHAKYFQNSIREDGLLAMAYHGVVYMPGSAGTLQEIFQDLAQNHYRTVRGLFSPMVFFDLDGHWTEHHPVRPVLRSLLRPQDLDLVMWTTDVDEAVEFLARFAPFRAA